MTNEVTLLGKRIVHTHVFGLRGGEDGGDGEDEDGDDGGGLHLGAVGVGGVLAGLGSVCAAGGGGSACFMEPDDKFWSQS